MHSESGIILNSVRDFMYVLFRHKGKILLVFLLVSLATAVVTYALPKIWESEASLLVRIGRENYPDDPSLEGAMVNLTQDRTAEVKSEVAILQSPLLAEQVVDSMGEGWILNDAAYRMEPIEGLVWEEPNLLQQLARQARGLLDTAMLKLKLKEPMTPHEKAVDIVRDGLLVDAEKQTNIVHVAFQGKDPDVSRVVLDRLLNAYLERHVEVFATPITPEFFQQKANTLHEELTQNERELDDFRREYGVADLVHQKQTLVNAIRTLQGELGDAGAEAKALEAKVARLRTELDSRPKMHEVARTTGLPNMAAEAIKERLLDLRLQEEQMAARYTDTHRPLMDLRAQIAEAEAELSREEPRRTEVTSQLDRNYEGIEHTYLMESANLEGLRARLDSLTADVRAHQEELARLASFETQLTALERARDISEQEYRDYLDSLQQATMTAQLSVDRVSNVRVVQPASNPLAPVRPNKVRNIALGLLLGLFAGLAVAFLSEFFDDSLNTTDAVERRLGVPVLVSVSEKEFKACT